MSEIGKGDYDSHRCTRMLPDSQLEEAAPTAHQQLHCTYEPVTTLMSWVRLMLVSETASMIPLSVDLMVVVFLSIAVGRAQIGSALSALSVLLLPPFRLVAHVQVLVPDQLGFV